MKCVYHQQVVEMEHATLSLNVLPKVDLHLDLVLQVLEYAAFLRRVAVMEQYQKIVPTSLVPQEQLVQVALLQYVSKDQMFVS